MAHIPPKRGSIHTEEPKPIAIHGEANTITITLPPFYAVTTSMSIKLSKDGGGVASVESVAADQTPGNSFKSSITRIVLYGFQGVSEGKEFIPNANGNCTVNIFFDHPA